MANPQLSRLPPEYIAGLVTLALTEDVGTGDLTAGLIPADRQAHAVVIVRHDLIVCGQAWFEEVFRQLDASIVVEWHHSDGQPSVAHDPICTVSGPARAILTGERTALNFLQLLSGTATISKAFVDAVAGTEAVILDTRKTLPGLRLAQKYAVTCGGARNHRIGLYDAILIKENHIRAAGSIAAAVGAAEQRADVLVEVEVESPDQLPDALSSGAGRLLLDNFSIPELCEAVKLRDQLAPGIGLEASGGITLGNVRSIAESGVDFISIGSLTKDVRAADLSMQFDPVG
jgi:nicotinate-nucleotide pyrophosphorylase (carboxylating)